MPRHELHFETKEQAEQVLRDLVSPAEAARIFEISHTWALEFRTEALLDEVAQALLQEHAQASAFNIGYYEHTLSFDTYVQAQVAENKLFILETLGHETYQAGEMDDDSVLQFQTCYELDRETRQLLISAMRPHHFSPNVFFDVPFVQEKDERKQYYV